MLAAVGTRDHYYDQLVSELHRSRAAAAAAVQPPGGVRPGARTTSATPGVRRGGSAGRLQRPGPTSGALSSPTGGLRSIALHATVQALRTTPALRRRRHAEPSEPEQAAADPRSVHPGPGRSARRYVYM